MAAKPLTTQSIALTEKKMDMSLDDIIRMSKTNTNKGSKQRLSNRNQNNSNNISQDKNAKVQRFMDTRSSMRQGALSQRRTNFQGNQFRLTTDSARKAAVTPIRGKTFNQRRAVDVNQPRVQQFPTQRRAANSGGPNVKQQAKQVPKQRPQTLDSLFANMKEQRMRSLSQQNIAPRRNGGDEEQIMRSFPQHNNGHRRNGASEEQRFRSFPQQYNGPRRNGGGGQQIVPWARGHFAR